MDNCSCGRSFEFMEFVFRKGITVFNYPLIKAGCPDCQIMFYYNVTQGEQEDMPHMNQLDWLRLRKLGRYALVGKQKDIGELPLFRKRI